MQTNQDRSSDCVSSESNPIVFEDMSPNIYVSDIHRTIAFYKFLGFEIIDAVPDVTNPIFVLMTSGNVSLMFQTFDSIKGSLPAVKREDGGSLLFYVKLKGVRKFYERIKDRVTILRGLEKTFYGATEFSILDDNNYMLTFAEDE
ncbi:MAG: VOC family protein [Flavisolibacter sp.]